MKDLYYSDNDYSEEEEEEEEVIKDKNFVKKELELKEMLKDIFRNVFAEYIKKNKHILNKLTEYSEDAFISFFEDNSSYYNYLESNQIK